MSRPVPGSRPRPAQRSTPPLRWDELRRFLSAALLTPVPEADPGPSSPAERRRRRVVTAATLLVGAAILGVSLRREPGDPWFYALTAVLALVWFVGAFASGPLRLGRAWTRSGSRARPVVQSIALGVLMVAIFCAGAVLVAQIEMLSDAVDAVLDHARAGWLPVVAAITLVNGIAEEVFFRGAVYASVPRFRVLISTVLYALATLATGNVMLVFAAAVLGLVVGLQRRVTGGVLGPIITHLIWSLSMLFLLPALLEALTR